MRLRDWFKEWAHVIMEAGMSKIVRMGQHARDQGGAAIAVQVYVPFGEEFLLPWGRSAFCSV